LERKATLERGQKIDGDYRNFHISYPTEIALKIDTNYFYQQLIRTSSELPRVSDYQGLAGPAASEAEFRVIYVQSIYWGDICCP
jgi:hypothetical protein